jgi:hypothetical protein
VLFFCVVQLVLRSGVLTILDLPFVNSQCDTFWTNASIASGEKENVMLCRTNSIYRPKGATKSIVQPRSTMVTMVTMGGDLQPGCLADRLLTGLGQPQINP